MDRDRDRDRVRIHATNEQRDQFRTCTQSADRVRIQAREMARQAGGVGFHPDQARQQRNQVREQVRTMLEHHEMFLNGLGQEQLSAAQNRLRTMNEIRERLNTRLRELDEQLEGRNLDGRRVAESAREVERAMKEWQKHQRMLGEEAGVKP